MNKISKKNTKLLTYLITSVAFCLIILSSSSKTAFAQTSIATSLASVASCSYNFTDATDSMSSLNVVPVGDKLNSPKQTFLKAKGCYLDGLAYSISKELLHSMTTSIVNWINTGFDGSPSFLTNPEGFFMDTADQITGAFISKTGILSELCSPFNIDLRLSIALSYTNRNKNTYKCTLSKIIENAKNSSITASANISVNGQSVANSSAKASAEGFLAGDFNQGGWPAFIALTTEPQNNVFGASLKAESDIKAQISAKNSTLSADISLGSGFMSWQNCTTVGTAKTSAEASQYAKQYNGNSMIKTTTNADGSITYKSCRTETPGSVISASLNKQLGSSVDEMVMVKNFNEAVSTIVSALISKTLQDGLLSISETITDSNVTESISSQLSSEQNTSSSATTQNISTIKQGMLGDLDSYIVPQTTYATLRTQAYSILSAEKAVLDNALACYSARGDAQSVASINYLLASSTPQLVYYQNKANLATNGLNSINAIRSAISSATTATELGQQSSNWSTLVTNKSLVTPQELILANDDLAAARVIATTLQTSSSPYRSGCSVTMETRGSVIP